MDLFPLHHETYYPKFLFENYRSLIWTERFDAYGEFQLYSPNIQETIDAFPLNSLVSLRDTDEVMMVESYSIEPSDETGEPEIVVSGRSLDSFLEHRVLLPPDYEGSFEWYRQYTPAQAICLLLWNALVNSEDQDPGRLPKNQKPYMFDSQLVIPRLEITMGSILPTPTQKWSFTGASTVSSVIQDIQRANQIGTRAIRPRRDGDLSYERVSFDTSIFTNERGLCNIETITDDTLTMQLEVYQGVDRTIDQNAVTPVVFRHNLGHVNDPKYLKTFKPYKSYAVVTSKEKTEQIFMGNEDRGFNRRVMIIDLPEGVAASRNLAADQAMAVQKVVAFADGNIAPTNPYEYGRDYFLGDTITFTGYNGTDASMFINEIVRTSDSNGENLSPGLINRSQVEADDIIIG